MKYVAIVGLFALTVGCGSLDDLAGTEDGEDPKEDGEGSGGSSPVVRLNASGSTSFLQRSDFDFSASGLTDLDKETLEETLNDMSVFVANEEDEDKAGTESESQKCFDDALDNKSLGSGDTVKMEMKGDFAECLNKKSKKGDTQFFEAFEAKFHLFSKVRCEGVDFSNVDTDEPFKSVFSDEVSACEQADRVETIFQAESHIDMELYFFGKTRMKVSSLQARQKKDGSPCVVDSARKLKEPCWVLKKETQDGAVPNPFRQDEDEDKPDKTVTVSRVVLPAGFSRDVQTTYYANTTLEFRVNGWEGTMTYTDGSTAPTWEATKDGTTQTGTLDPD